MINDKELFLWKYSGPIFRFNHIYSDKYEDTTYAKTEKKALSNITYKAKKKFGFTATTEMKLSPKHITKIKFK